MIESNMSHAGMIGTWHENLKKKLFFLSKKTTHITSKNNQNERKRDIPVVMQKKVSPQSGKLII